MDEDEVRAAVRMLVDQEHVEAVAVAYLFSYVNPRHEQRTRAIIAETAPGMTVSLSSEVDPMFREYERTAVTTFDAYVRPVIERYVRDLAAELQAIGIDCAVQIMQSRGGITSAEMVARRPVSVLLSGPAAGVIGGKYAGERSGCTTSSRSTSAGRARTSASSPRASRCSRPRGASAASPSASRWST